MNPLILKKPRLFIRNFFSEGHERSVRVKKNIFASLIIKGGSIALSLLIVPLTINYVNPTQYGVWLTLSSIISWFSFFDIGLGNGLKNKLAETNAIGKTGEAKIYVSTTYAVLSLISLALFIVFSIANPFIGWEKILNITSIEGAGLQKITFSLFFFFCVQFVVQIINTVLTANHATAKSSMVNFIGQLLSFALIFVLTKTTRGSIFYLVLAFAGIPVLVQLIFSIWLYKTRFSGFAPSFKMVRMKHAKSLLNVGLVFFIIQIGALVLYQTDNIIITQLFGPSEVTTFNITYKLFSVILMIFTIFMAPFWSSFTEAYAKKDMQWLGDTMTKLKKYWLFMAGLTALLLIASPLLFKLWMGDTVKIPLMLSLAMALYVVGYAWQLIHCYFLNGITKLRIQLYLFVISTIMNIPLAIFLGHKIGLAGIVLSNVIVLFIMGIIFSVQCKKIINQTATGLWNR